LTLRPPSTCPPETTRGTSRSSGLLPAVLGDLGFAAGKDGAVLGDTDDVRKSVQVEGTQTLQIG